MGVEPDGGGVDHHNAGDGRGRLRRGTVQYQFGDDAKGPFGREDDITELRLSLTNAAVARA